MECTEYRKVLDDALKDEIKDLTADQIQQVLEYISQLKQRYSLCNSHSHTIKRENGCFIFWNAEHRSVCCSYQQQGLKHRNLQSSIFLAKKKPRILSIYSLGNHSQEKIHYKFHQVLTH